MTIGDQPLIFRWTVEMLEWLAIIWYWYDWIADWFSWTYDWQMKLTNVFWQRVSIYVPDHGSIFMTQDSNILIWPLLNYLSTLKLPSLLAAWLFWTFHTKSHNRTALVIHDHHLSHLFIYMGKMNFCGLLCVLLDYPCQSHDHDHQWADLVMAWLL